MIHQKAGEGGAWRTNHNLTDGEVCYKVFKLEAIDQIELKVQDSVSGLGDKTALLTQLLEKDA